MRAWTLWGVVKSAQLAAQGLSHSCRQSWVCLMSWLLQAYYWIGVVGRSSKGRYIHFNLDFRSVLTVLPQRLSWWTESLDFIETGAF